MKLKIKQKKKIKVFSTFSGVGGFEMGLDHDKFATVGFCEIDKYCKSVLRYRWPGVINYGSVADLKPEELPDFDLLAGGWPCQGNSIAGARKGLSDPRSGLFMDLVKVLKAKRPKYFIFENVLGLLSVNKGRDFALVQNELAETGYDFRWEVLNAKDFGVPQNRERVFIIGHLRGESGGELLLKTGSCFQDHARKESSGKDGNDENRKVGRDLSYCLDANYHKGTNTVEKGRRQLVFYGGVGEKWNKKSEKNQSRDFKQGNRVYHETGISPALSSKTGQNAKGSVLVAYSKSTREGHVDHRARFNDSANTLNTGDGCRSQSTANYVCAESKIRRLTPKECERLMSWRENHTRWGIDEEGVVFELSDNQRYKQCGNGIVSNVVKAISKVVWEDFKSSEK